MLRFTDCCNNLCCRNTCFKKETLAQLFSCEFGEISKNTFFYRTPPVAAFYEYLHSNITQGILHISPVIWVFTVCFARYLFTVRFIHAPSSILRKKFQLSNFPKSNHSQSSFSGLLK